MNLIQETYKPGQNVSSVARLHGIFPSQLFLCRKCRENCAVVVVGAEEQIVAETEHKKALSRICDLEKALGKSTLQFEILKKAVRIGREKNSSRVHHWSVWTIFNETQH
jgi:transposase